MRISPKRHQCVRHQRMLIKICLRLSRMYPVFPWSESCKFRYTRCPCRSNHGCHEHGNGGQPLCRECFGTNENPYPLLLVDKRINDAKGRIIALHQAVDTRRLTEQTRRALDSQDEEDWETMFNFIRSVSVHPLVPLAHLDDAKRYQHRHPQCSIT